MFKIEKSIKIRITRLELEEIILQLIAKELNVDNLQEPTIEWEDDSMSITALETDKKSPPIKTDKKEEVTVIEPKTTTVPTVAAVVEKVEEQKAKLGITSTSPFSTVSFKKP